METKKVGLAYSRILADCTSWDIQLKTLTSATLRPATLQPSCQFWEKQVHHFW